MKVDYRSTCISRAQVSWSFCCPWRSSSCLLWCQHLALHPQDCWWFVFCGSQPFSQTYSGGCLPASVTLPPHSFPQSQDSPHSQVSFLFPVNTSARGICWRGPRAVGEAAHAAVSPALSEVLMSVCFFPASPPSSSELQEELGTVPVSISSKQHIQAAAGSVHRP